MARAKVKLRGLGKIDWPFVFALGFQLGSGAKDPSPSSDVKVGYLPGYCRPVRFVSIVHQARNQKHAQ